jgi:hypothetical protein
MRRLPTDLVLILTAATATLIAAVLVLAALLTGAL